MLQNPSKYHPNPLSHFLALHSTQAAHNARNNGNSASHILTNVSAFNLGGDQRNGSFQHHQHQQQQQQQHTLLATQQQQQHHHQQQQQDGAHTLLQHNLNSTTHAHQQHAQFLDATGTTLDVGKSFTIAAILGLQNRNGIEHNHRRDYNSVINLSMNGGNNNNNNNNNNDDDDDISGGGGGGVVNHTRRQQCGTPPPIGSENVASKQNANDDSHDRNSNRLNNSSDNNKFHCDSNTNLVNQYLPITTATTTTATINTNVFMASAAHHHQLHHQQQHQHQQHQQQQHQQQQHQLSNHHHHPLISNHVRANSFAAAAAVAAVNAVVNGTPTALQSLQQLHQHHAQQTTLNFSREKLKVDSHTKKASLKNKRVRTIFTPEQLERLEAEFERQQYMVGPERLYLAHTLQLTEAQVKVWFQNRRIKWRKHHLELTQQRLALLRQNQLPTTNTTSGIGSLPSPDGLVTAASNSSFEENDEPNAKSEEARLTNSQKSHTESDSELSICNDSMDADSINDGGGDT